MFSESQQDVHCPRRRLHKLVGFGRALSMWNALDSRIAIGKLLTGCDETLPILFKTLSSDDVNL